MPRQLNMKSTCLLVAMMVLLICGNRATANLTTYAIGNSLTWDIMLAGGFDSTTVNQPNPSTSSRHIRCGSSLTATLANPEDVCVPPTSLGLFSEALLGPIDNLFLQPYYGATVRQEIDSMKILVDLARMNPDNADMQVFVYGTWARNTVEAPFLSTWNNHVASLESGFVPSASTYELVMSTLRAEGYDARLIPAGHTFAAITEAMNAGLEIEGLISPDDLYRDVNHASNAGKYAAAVSAFATVYNMDPSGQTMATAPFTLPGYGPVLTGEGVAIVQGIAWGTYLSVNAETVSPNDFEITTGNYVGGNVDDLANSDDVDLIARRNNQSVSSLIVVEIEGVSPIERPFSLTYTFENAVFARGTVVQNIQLFNYETGTFEQIDSRDAGKFSDLRIEVTPAGDPARFVEIGTGSMKAQIRFQSNAKRQNFSANLDQAIWTIIE